MKPRYLETYHFRKYKDYCSSKCISIVYEQEGKDEYEKNSLRGEYKGFIFCKKLFGVLLLRKKSITNFELYAYLKNHVSLRCKAYSEANAVRDVMNLLCEEFD